MQNAPNQAFSYDAENRLISAAEPGTASIAYAYDGDGNRVQKTVGSATTTYVYDANGELAAEYGTSADSGTSYVSVDQLGSTRLLQRSSGAVQRYDYLPFGEDIPAGQFGGDSSYASGAYPASGPDFLSFKFTGKERDAETGLDYFGARYMSSAQGRFTSPDPVYFQKEMVQDPQRFNLYSYTRNNPLRFTDPSGERIELSADENERSQQLNALCSMAGQKAGCLQVDTSEEGHYYVQANEDFSKLNAVAADLQKLIDNPLTATLDLVGGNDRIGPNGKYTLNTGGPGAPNGADGLTVFFGGQIHVYVRKEDDPRNYATLGNDYMSDGGYGAQNQNTVLGHELGHALYLMHNGGSIPREDPRSPHLIPPGEAYNNASLRLENKVRQLEDKNAAVRIAH